METTQLEEDYREGKKRKRRKKKERITKEICHITAPS